MSDKERVNFEDLHYDWKRSLHDLAGKIHTVAFCAEEIQEGNLNYKRLYQNLNNGVDELFEMINSQNLYVKGLESASSIQDTVDLAILRFKLRHWKKRSLIDFNVEVLGDSCYCAWQMRGLSEVLTSLLENLNEKKSLVEIRCAKGKEEISVISSVNLSLLLDKENWAKDYRVDYQFKDELNG